MKKITVCTPTYNRARLLELPFKSLMNQSCKNFTWIIIDDGSTDNTYEIVKKFIAESDFKIEYFKKENGGRHTALNYSYDKIKTEWVINLDSDDELLPTAIEDLYELINSIPQKEYNRFWQISGRTIDSENRKIVGRLFEDNVNNLKGKKQRKSRLKSNGEKSNCRKTEILRKYPFPEYETTKFITENTVWKKIDLEYDTYCTNKIFRVYHQDSQDSLTKGKIHTKDRNYTYYYYGIFCINELFEEIFFNKEIITSICNVPRKAMLCNIKYKDLISQINKWYKKLIVTIIGYPIAYIYIKIKMKKQYN